LEFKQIKQIVDLMKRSGLTEFELEEKDFSLRLCRKNEADQAIYAATPQPMAAAMGPAAGSGQSPAPAEPPVSGKDQPVQEGKLIKSPMVGTFYAAPSPDSPPFVRESDSVNEETVVCIVEAMKVMNEIKAECKGVIAEVLIQNGDSVEYGQPLFRLK
jgi:acetyl-CoA carboxylase biotin carboxyl carrier protein